MRMSVTLISALAGFCVAGSAHASELEPMAGLSIELGDVLGAAYYTVEKDGYQVVATVASGANATPVRFVTTLTSGQRTMLSVPRAIGESALALKIERIGDRVFVNSDNKLSSLTH